MRPLQGEVLHPPVTGPHEELTAAPADGQQAVREVAQVEAIGETPRHHPDEHPVGADDELPALGEAVGGGRDVLPGAGSGLGDLHVGVGVAEGLLQGPTREGVLVPIEVEHPPTGVQRLQSEQRRALLTHAQKEPVRRRLMGRDELRGAREKPDVRTAQPLDEPLVGLRERPVVLLGRVGSQQHHLTEPRRGREILGGHLLIPFFLFFHSVSVARQSF